MKFITNLQPGKNPGDKPQLPEGSVLEVSADQEAQYLTVEVWNLNPPRLQLIGQVDPEFSNEKSVKLKLKRYFFSIKGASQLRINAADAVGQESSEITDFNII